MYVSYESSVYNPLFGFSLAYADECVKVNINADNTIMFSSLFLGYLYIIIISVLHTIVLEYHHHNSDNQVFDSDIFY